MRYQISHIKKLQKKEKQQFPALQNQVSMQSGMIVDATFKKTCPTSPAPVLPPMAIWL
jgi:hypothetical protein